MITQIQSRLHSTLHMNLTFANKKKLRILINSFWGYLLLKSKFLRAAHKNSSV